MSYVTVTGGPDSMHEKFLKTSHSFHRMSTKQCREKVRRRMELLDADLVIQSTHLAARERHSISVARSNDRLATIIGL